MFNLSYKKWLLYLLGGLSVVSAFAKSQGIDVNPPPFIPGLGEIMNSNIQPHHIKLGLAGELQNWALANYELDELIEAFETVKIYQPMWDNKPISKMQAAFMDNHFIAIKNAIREKDKKLFIKEYRELTNSCNACHEATGREFIVITPPKKSSFPNQNFKIISQTKKTE